MARKELHQLLEHVDLNGIPVLVVANKIDVEGRMPKDELTKSKFLERVATNLQFV
jgi:signal recognition particle receptor subunit beta